MAAVVSITPFLHRPSTTGALLGERGTPAQKGGDLMATTARNRKRPGFTVIVLRSWDEPERWDHQTNVDWQGYKSQVFRVIVLPRKGAPIVHDGVRHIRRPGYEVGRPQLALMGNHGRRLACYPVRDLREVIIEEAKQPGRL